MNLIKDINDVTRAQEAEELAKVTAQAETDAKPPEQDTGKSIADYMADIAQKSVDKT